MFAAEKTLESLKPWPQSKRALQVSIVVIGIFKVDA